MARCASLAVKLGGSLITVKDRPYTIRWEALRRAARALAAYERSGGRLVVVHGGGSFGHVEVERLKSTLGEPLPPQAAPRIQAAMLRLATAVLGELLSAGLPAVLHTTHTICGCGGCGYKPLERDWGEGLTPIVYGDAVACSGGVAIVSGDRLLVEAAQALGVECVVFAIDKPGILGPQGRVLESLRPGEEPPLLAAGGPDVTGGIRAKLDWAYRAAGLGAKVYITGLEGLLKVLSGGSPPTRIEA